MERQERDSKPIPREYKGYPILPAILLVSIIVVSGIARLKIGEIKHREHLEAVAAQEETAPKEATTPQLDFWEKIVEETRRVLGKEILPK